MLNRTGKVLFVTGPTAPSHARLHRSQALAFGDGVGLEISRTLIDAKVQDQERLVRERLNDPVTADVIARFRDKLPTAENVEMIRTLESRAAASYFGAWRNIEVMWPQADLRKIPSHWRTVGARQSPLSGGPRLAVTPVHAILNYCFALLEAETRLALSALGLLPDLGLGLHADTPNRDSLVFDVVEPVRPQVEKWLLSWVTREPLCRSDFFETATGNCRLTSHLCARLSETAPTWGKLVAPWAEYVAQTVWSGTKPRHGNNSVLPTRLTQQRRTEAKGKVWIHRVTFSKADHLCRGCGKTIQVGRTNCARCAVDNATTNMVAAALIGRQTAHSPEAQLKRTNTQRRNALAQHAWNKSSQPEWLTEDFFLEKIQLLLAQMSASAIARRISVSRWYAGRIREGYRPHPRHWRALAELVGVSGS